MAASVLYTADSGVRAFGWARFVEAQLCAVELLRADNVNAMINKVRCLHTEPGASLVIEKPRVYRERQWKGDPNDLIDVALVAGAAGTLGRFHKFVHPDVWKGSVPKHIHTKRVLARLDRNELELVQAIRPKSLQHNAIDAVGIGLWTLGRM